VARGEDLAPFIPYRPPTRHEEAMDLEWPIDNLEALAFALGGVVDRLVARLTSRGWMIGVLGLTLGLTDHSTREYALSLASPLADGRAITSLILQRLRSDPPPAVIERIAIQAEPVRPRLAQGSLFAPSSISPERVAATLARLDTLAGMGRFGSPELLNSHRPDAFRMNPFDGSCARSGGAMSRPLSRSPAGSPLPVLRRCRPSPDAIVETAPDGSPVKISSARVSGTVRIASGPWRSFGEWWADTGWSCEEWDVELAGGHLVRLAFDRARQAWSIEGVYD
jgi:protein ImuB